MGDIHNIAYRSDMSFMTLAPEVGDASGYHIGELMKCIKTTLIGLLVCVSTVFSFEIDPYDPKAPLLENLSTNCLQVTQGQQMFKAYIMAGLHSHFQNPRKNLLRAVPLFDKRAHQLRRYFQERLDGHVKEKKAFDEAMVFWQANKKMLEAEPTKENAIKIKKNFQQMNKKLKFGVKPLVTPKMRLLSLTGKLCKKPFEITIDYLMAIWGIKDKQYTAHIDKIIASYAEKLKILSANSLNNAESQKLLKEAKEQFMYFEFAHQRGTLFIPSLLSKKADNNFRIIREIKKIFKRKTAEE